MWTHLVCVAAVGLQVPVGAGPVVVYVDDDAAPGGDGASWATAFDDLQDALDAARLDPNIDEIRVGEGLYRPDRGTGDRTAAFELVGGCDVVGGFAGTGASDPDARIFATFLDGDLAGNDGGGSFADNSFHLLTAAALGEAIVVDGFYLIGGNADGAATLGEGAALRTFDSSVTMIDCVLAWNQATRGGAIAAFGGSVSLVRCSFLNLEANDTGGAIHAEGVTLTLDDCVMLDCSSLASGAGIRAVGGSIDIVASSFVRATTVFGSSIGGAVSVDDAEVCIDGCDFRECVTGHRGGAIGVSGASTTTLVDSRFAGCRATIGGAVWTDAPLTGTALLIAANHSEGVGGGMSVVGSQLTLEDCTFDLNDSDGGAGGLHVGNADVAISNTTFRQNLAQDSGGGLRLDSATGLVCRCDFADNIAVDQGGGIRVTGSGSNVTIAESTFRRNDSDYGTAVDIGSVVHVLVEDCDFEDNFGPAINKFEFGQITIDSCRFREDHPTNDHAHVVNVGRNSTSFIKDSSFIECTARPLRVGSSSVIHRCSFVASEFAGVGGALVVDTHESVFVENSLFLGNELTDPGDDGGAIYKTGSGVLELTNCTVVANTATRWGGGIFVNNGDLAVSNCVIWGNAALGRVEEAQIDGSLVDVTVDHSCIMGWTGSLGGVGNIGDDPDFRHELGADGVFGTADDDLRLLPASPCIDAGDDGDVSSGFDLDGAARQVGVVDMGSYEFAASDCDANGVDDAVDVSNAPWIDCNLNGLIDACEIAAGTAADCDGNGVPDSCDLAAGAADCDDNGVIDTCDIASGAAPDCDGDGLPDTCQLVDVVLLASGQAGPIDSASMQTVEFTDVPVAVDLVSFVVVGQGDFAAETQWVEMLVGGVEIGRLFDTELNCENPGTEVRYMSATAFNDVVENGTATVDFVASAPVGACGGSYVSVEIGYRAASSGDGDADGLLDVCEADLDGDGDVDVADLLQIIANWGPCPACPADIDDDGVVGISDLLIVLAAWT